MVLRVMAAQGHRTAVLGAWGCGVFRNDPREVATAFAEWLRGEMAGGEVYDGATTTALRGRERTARGTG